MLTQQYNALIQICIVVFCYMLYIIIIQIYKKKMEEVMFKHILSSEGAVLYESIFGELKYSNSGTLNVFLSIDGLLLLKINQFEYGVNPKDPIKYNDKDPQYQRVFFLKKYPNDIWVLKINDNYDCVESLLREKCHLQNKNEAKSESSGRYSYATKTKKKMDEDQQIQQKGVQKAKKVQKKKSRKVEQPPQIDQQAQSSEQKQVPKKTLNFGSLVKSGAKLLGKGLSAGGKILSKGFENMGEYIAKKVQPKQKVEISDNAQKNLKLVAKSTDTVLKFTSTQVGNLFNFGLKMAGDISERVQQTEKAQQFKKSPYYEPLKSAGKTTIIAFSNIYEGVWNAAYSIGSGIANGTTKVIQKKYGDEAGQVADNAFETAGNVTKLTRVANDQLANVLKQ